VAGADDIRGFGRDVRRFADDWPAHGIGVVDDAIEQRLRADSGDGALSHDRGGGRATTRIVKGSATADVVADGNRGVWGILEGGTRPHTVTAGRGRLLRTPYGPRRSVNVSGVRGKRTFTLGAERGLEDAVRDAEAQWAKVGG
jgi:hypothetical protein